MESRLSRDDKALLERVYNLRGEDSAVIKTIEAKKTEIADGKIEKEKRMEALETEISTLEDDKESLKEQTDKFVEDFKGFEKETYNLVLGKLKIEFDPQAMVTKVQDEAPKEISRIEETLGSKSEELSSLKAEIKDAEALLQQSEQELDDAIKTQENLNKLIDELLNGNENITKQQIMDLFGKLGFTLEETNKIGSILFFSNILKDYEEDLIARERAETNGKNIGQIMFEAQAQATQAEVEEKQPEEDTKEEIDINEIVVENVLEEPANNYEPDEEIKVEPTIEETNILEQLGINPSNLTENEINTLKNTDSVILTSNLKIFNDLQIRVEENAIALADKELSDKVKLLEGLDKKKQDLMYATDLLMSYTLEQLKSNIKMVEETGLNVNELPLEVLRNPQAYTENIRDISTNVGLDDNEILKHSSSIASMDTNIYKTNIDAGFQYGITWKKPNGKFANEAIIQTTSSLVSKIDRYIEAGEEEVLAAAPELLARDAESTIAGITAMRTYGADYKMDKYRKVLCSEEKLEEVFGTITVQSVPTVEENNESLKNIIGNDSCINAINAEIDNAEYYDIKEDGENAITLSSLIQMVESLADETTEHSYTIAGTRFSSVKFKRNILCLLNKAIQTSNEELIMASLATNSNKTDEELKKVASVLGFNLAMGGR